MSDVVLAAAAAAADLGGAAAAAAAAIDAADVAGTADPPGPEHGGAGEPVGRRLLAASLPYFIQQIQAHSNNKEGAFIDSFIYYSNSSRASGNNSRPY